MTLLLWLAVVLDAAFFALVARRVVRSRARGVSLRLRIFGALVASMLLGALATGLYATAVDAETLGFAERFARVAPKGFLVASTLLPVLAGAAAWVGARLARPVEELSDAAARIAEGEEPMLMRSGQGAEAQKLARALTSMRREIEDKPYAAAFLRDAWHDLKTPVAAIRRRSRCSRTGRSTTRTGPLYVASCRTFTVPPTSSTDDFKISSRSLASRPRPSRRPNRSTWSTS